MKLGSNLTLQDGIWFADRQSAISYPEDGNDTCFQVEDSSFWFNHRNSCIATVVDNYRAKGYFLDVGGGNGFVSAMLQAHDQPVCLLEPGLRGCLNAKQRGVDTVVCATLQDIRFEGSEVGAIGAFDVVEHVEDDIGFLQSCYSVLPYGGTLFITVPAFNYLWSHEDVRAGHYRRYTLTRLENTATKAGFRTEYSTYFFSLLVPPIFLLRTIAFKLGMRKESNEVILSKEHGTSGDWSAQAMSKLLSYEVASIEKGKTLRVGSSCLLVATKI